MRFVGNKVGCRARLLGWRRFDSTLCDLKIVVFRSGSHVLIKYMFVKALTI